MKKLLSFLLSLIFLICLTGCSNTKTKDMNPLIGKIYSNNTHMNDSFDFDFIQFYDDKTFQALKTGSATKSIKTGKLEFSYTNYYGTYTIDGNALTINLSENNYACVIDENGESIKCGKEELKNITDDIKKDDPLLEKFQK